MSDIGFEIKHSEKPTSLQRKPFTRRAIIKRKNLEIGTLKSQNEELERENVTDHLTGLDNLRGFTKKLKAEISRLQRERRKNNGTQNEPITCATVDLNRFKELNDKYGHMVGDAALISVADILRTNLRPYDIIGRKSDASDEFMVVMVGADLDAAKHRFEEIFGQLQTHNSSPTSISVSVGICPLDIDNENKSLHESDLAMYRAKQRITPDADKSQNFLEVVV